MRVTNKSVVQLELEQYRNRNRQTIAYLEGLLDGLKYDAKADVIENSVVIGLIREAINIAKGEKLTRK